MKRSNRTIMGGMESTMPKTRWSLILGARTQDQTRRKLAIENLALAYWRSASSPLQQDIAAIIYSGAIANALVHHDFKFTKLSYKDLSEAYAELSQYNWLSSELKDIFSRANEQCRKYIRK